MKVLVVNRSDSRGGAANQAYALYSALGSNSIESYFLVRDKFLDEPLIIKNSSFKINIINKIDKNIVRLYPSRTSLFSVNILKSGFINIIKELKPDIIHLNWIAGGLISMNELSKINIPIVWTMHDMWPFSGGCHYDNFCNRFKNNCGICPVLGSKSDKDISEYLLRKKLKVYNKLNITFISPSHWLRREASSGILRNLPIHVVPTPMDTNKFKPKDKLLAKKRLGLDHDKEYILFGAISSTTDKRKGYNYIKESLEISMIDRSKVELLIFGNYDGEKKGNLFGFNVTYFGNVFDEDIQISLYSASSVTLSPSVQENLSTIILESMACGTSVVAFNIGGNPDMISKNNGYLATPYNSNDFSKGIEKVLVNSKKFGENARSSIIKLCDKETIVKRLNEIYSSLL